jgi:hypothetical protein
MEEVGKTLDGDSVTRSGRTSPRSLEVIRYQMFKFIVNALNDILSVVEWYLVVKPQKLFPGRTVAAVTAILHSILCLIKRPSSLMYRRL